MVVTSKDTRKYQTSIAQRKITLASIVSESEAETVIPVNGELLQYMVVAPNLTTDTTYDFSIINDDSVTVYTNTGIADNATTLVKLSAAPVPMAGSLTFKVDFTTNQVASFDIYLYYK